MCSYICENKDNDPISLWILWDNLVTLISNTNLLLCPLPLFSKFSPLPNNRQNDSHVYSHLQQKTLSSVVLQYNEEKLQMSREAATTQRQSED